MDNAQFPDPICHWQMELLEQIEVSYQQSFVFSHIESISEWPLQKQKFL